MEVFLSCYGVFGRCLEIKDEAHGGATNEWLKHPNLILRFRWSVLMNLVVNKQKQ